MNKIKYAVLHTLLPVFVLGAMLSACAIVGGEAGIALPAALTFLFCCACSLCRQELRRMELAEARSRRRAARRPRSALFHLVRLSAGRRGRRA